MRKIIIGLLLLLSVGANSQWQQTGSKVRYVNGLGIPTKDTAAGVSADSSQIVIRPADSSLYVKYKRTWLRVGGGGGSIAGSGTTNYVPKFTSSSAIGNSQIFDNGTNVGVGTTTPGYKLNLLYTQSSNTFQGFSINATTIGKNYGILSGNATGGGLFGLTNPFTGFIHYTDAAATSYINDGSGYFSWHNSSAELMRLTNGGNVGIGTASPGAMLHLYNSSVATQLRIQSDIDQASLRLLSGNGTTNRASRIDFLNGVNSTTVPIWTLISDYNQNGTNDFSIVTNNSTQHVVITSAGNVGIGTTSPAAKLSVQGTTLINTNTDNGVDKLQVNGSILSTQYKLSALNTAPATASSTGTLGEIRIDANYIYICTATNTWKRVAIATW